MKEPSPNTGAFVLIGGYFVNGNLFMCFIVTLDIPCIEFDKKHAFLKSNKHSSCPGIIL